MRQLNVRLDEDLIERLRRRAITEEKTLGEALGEAIELWLAQESMLAAS